MGMKDKTPTTVEEYQAYKENYSNWGRWGADDQLGTLNHISQESVKYASSLVTEGYTVSCSNPVATSKVVDN